MSKNNNTSKEKSKNPTIKIPTELSPVDYVFHLYSGKELIIEGAKSIDHYDEDNIKLNLGKMSVNIKGKGLHMKFLANMNLAIIGFVEGIELANR